MALAETNAV